MDVSEIKDILKDRVKLAYIVSFSTLAFVGFLLIVKIDIGGILGRIATQQDALKGLKMLEEVAAYQKYIGTFDLKVAGKKDEQWMIKFITDAAKENDLVLELVKPMTPERVNGYDMLGVIVEGSGKYHNIGKFAADVENSDRYLYFESFNLRAKDIGGFNQASGVSGSGQGFRRVGGRGPAAVANTPNMFQGVPGAQSMMTPSGFPMQPGMSPMDQEMMRLMEEEMGMTQSPQQAPVTSGDPSDAAQDDSATEPGTVTKKKIIEERKTDFRTIIRCFRKGK
ncbi:MAG: type 4a pilus biogenesis protein PilO [Candidatus Omnitrophica bacterium]|nr:type 4a pilus biogenesis protein PilO [Candidatus Omnitrophota bacterium]MDD5488527.1 type 4a pilus biogenesis protein PilO [Candidatus Omnitrophota bacterium]